MSAFRQSFSWDGFIRTGIAPEALCAGAAGIGYAGVELVEPDVWPLIRDHGLSIVSITGHPLNDVGLNKRENLAILKPQIVERIELAGRESIPYVLCFSGNRYAEADEQTAAEITADNLRALAPYAEAAGVTLVLELLNSRPATRNYQADHSAWGIRVCERVDSPRVRLLYDIFHMQIMEGDIINTIRNGAAWFGHYHTAGNPGRNDLDETQELNYRAIARAIAEVGHSDFVGHEFFPKGDPVEALRAAFAVCDVA